VDVTRVLLVEPRGFCAGVESAVAALAWVVALEGPPVYCLHEIVHNDAVADRFRRLGVVFVDDVDVVPMGATLVLSAHGTSPSTAAGAARRASVLVDAVCPLVSKVHREILQRTRAGYTVLYAGRPGHDESVGALGIAPEVTHLVANPAEAAQVTERLDGERRVALVSQTTMVIEEIESIEHVVRERRPDLWTRARSDLCYATTNRQRAIRQVAAEADTVVVVGSASSSNTASLVRAAVDAGCSDVVRVDRPEELPARLTATVAVTAGASAPESAVAAVVRRLAPRDGVQTVRLHPENEQFALPRELRTRIAAAVRAGTLPEPLVEVAGREPGEVPLDQLLDVLGRASRR
jgi:4-hydroxy-3-methylbut-2-en-1-yl diphosphate reductase